MDAQIGPQYAKDYPFKAKARLHQSKFLTEVLHADFQDYGNRLAENYARAGKNFYPGLGVFEAVKKRYPNYSQGVYADMLRSEHIPFNIFIPLSLRPEILAKAFSRLLSIDIFSVDKVIIEHAPHKAKAILQDHTSFDTYIEYTSFDGIKGCIGVEVKYTELEYKLNLKSTEAKTIALLFSPYNSVTVKSGVFKDGVVNMLRKDKFRQIWRNQLLGEAMLIAPKSRFKQFTSVTLYPSGNFHFTETLHEYKSFLLPRYQNRVVGITYEALFDKLSELASTIEYTDWVKWLKRRYIVLE